MSREIPKIAVVILTKDRPDLLLAVSAGLDYQKDVTTVVYVIDNGDNDDSTKQACLDYGWFYYREPIESYSDGCNRGARRALQDDPAIDGILFLNNDVTFTDPFTLRNMYDLMPRVSVVGVRILNSDGSVNHDGVTFHNGIPIHMGRNMVPEVRPNELVPSVTFACVLIRPDVWRQVGGLSEEYWFGFEDTDFCLRARIQGYRVGVMRSSHIVHDEKTTRTGEEDERNLALYLKNWYTKIREVPFNDVGETIND